MRPLADEIRPQTLDEVAGQKHLLGEDAPYEGDDCRQQVALWECGTVYGEVERTAAQIRKLVASGACRWRDIAVTARNMEVYGPVIESVFQRDGIPAYISTPQTASTLRISRKYSKASPCPLKIP